MWNKKELEQALSQPINLDDFNTNSLVIDSRKIKENDIFVALKGEHADGHLFIEDALSRGAIVAITEANTNIHNTIIVPNSLNAILDLAKYRRTASKAEIIGVTGSSGKTSTKEALMIALQPNAYCSEGNYNNHIGVPISLANLDPNSLFAIFEMGMSAKNEIRELTKLVNPSIAIITNIAPAHLKFFDSLEDIASAKAEIFETQTPLKHAILNKDNPFFETLKQYAKQANVQNIISFGTSKSDATLLSYEQDNNIASIKADIMGDIITYQISASGIHQALNTIVALSVVKLLNLDIQQAAHSLTKFNVPKGRGGKSRLKINNNNITLIDDSYNANPASMKASLAYVAGMSGHARKVAVLGSMLELGPSEIAFHTELLADFIKSGCVLIALGDLMSELYDILPTELKLAKFGNIDELSKSLPNLLQDGDLLLIKGSFGTKLHTIANNLPKMF